MILTHLPTIVVLYQRHNPKDGRITSRNMSAKITQIETHNDIEVLNIWVAC